MNKLYRLFLKAASKQDSLAMRVFNQECQAYYIEHYRDAANDSIY